MAVPWSIAADGVMLTVRLTPKGGRDALDGIETLADGKAVLRARVKAVPDRGEANAALEKLLARALDVPSRAVSVVAGATSRVKRVRVFGDGEALAARIARIESIESSELS